MSLVSSYAQQTKDPQSNDPQPINSIETSSGKKSLASQSSALLGHINFVTTDVITHFRYADSGPGQVTARDEFYKLSTRVQIDLVGDGVTYIQARGESGKTFVSSYDFMGIGAHAANWSFNLKSLYVGQKVGKHIEAQAGGIEYDQGVGTEATYNDNDAWLVGYRLRYTGLGHHLPEKVSVTVGYVGDFLQPNAFARLPRMGDENYIQVLAVKKLTKDADFSAEFDSFQSIRYTREALRWQKILSPAGPDLTLETITRVTDNPTFGWAGNLGRNFDKRGRFRPGMFFSDIPKGMFQLGSSQVFMNGDFYALGKRVGPSFKFAPTKNFDVTLMGSDRLDSTPGTRYRGQIAVHYQLAGMLNRLR